MEKKQMNEPVSRYVFDSIMAQNERHIKRLWIVIILLIVFLVCSNAGWLIYESQFEEISYNQEIEAEQDGNLNFISGGDINYGTESQSDNNR